MKGHTAQIRAMNQAMIVQPKTKLITKIGPLYGWSRFCATIVGIM